MYGYIHNCDIYYTLNVTYGILSKHKDILYRDVPLTIGEGSILVSLQNDGKNPSFALGVLQERDKCVGVSGEFFLDIESVSESAGDSTMSRRCNLTSERQFSLVYTTLLIYLTCHLC